MTDYRIERDSLGEMRVPADALYGSQTQRAVENFPISGRRFGRRFIEALGFVKWAAAEANAELGLIEEGVARAIAEAALAVAEGAHDKEFVLDIYQTGSGTSSNMNANEVIARLASRAAGKAIHPNDHVNFGQSSNDVIPTAMHVAVRLEIDGLLVPELDLLGRSLEAKAEEFDGIVKSGRTHLMDATPVRLGQQFGGYAAQVTKGLTRVKRAAEELDELALGGTATGTGINTHPRFARTALKRLASRTGTEWREADDHFEAQGAKDAAVNVSGSLNTLATSLIKIADDLRWLGSGPTSGLAEIVLPAVQPGSSIMPGKVNPVMSEALMMVCARVMGNHHTVTIAGSRGNFELNVMMPVLAHALLESVTVLGNAASAFRTRCIDGIRADEARIRQLLECNPAVATALNPYIGYDAAATVAKEAAARGVSVREVVLERGLVPPDQVDDALDVRAMTEPGLPELGTPDSGSVPQ